MHSALVDTPGKSYTRPRISTPLISVVITCYNHARYLPQSIESILAQEIDDVEIVLVDDGSTDNTKEAAQKYEGVKYVYQHNQGLSAARNTGVRESKGDYLVFLDADDWLLPGALQSNVELLAKNPGAAFSFGRHQIYYEKENNTVFVKEVGERKDYNDFLKHGNFIGMHATVMYHRWVFNHFEYDITLKACEDYDLYMKIARRFPVIHHSNTIAAYRMHNTNMSGNISLMLQSALDVLKRQQVLLKNSREKKDYKQGIRFWQDYYCRLIYKDLFFATSGPRVWTEEERNTLKTHSKKLYIKAFLKRTLMPYTNLIKKRLPVPFLRMLHRAGLYGRFLPPPGKAKLGDFNRIFPLSTEFGYDRGGPVDRYYIENFLEEEKHLVKGRVLEIGDNEYTLRYGGKNVKQSDILHVDASNEKATFVGDLTDAPHIPDNTFDCFILTQTLHLIYDYKKAIETCYRVLKPGGTLLVTVPGISHIDKGEWYKNWLWSFTDSSIKRMFAEVFPVDNMTVLTYGNVLAASAFLFGLGLPELKKEQLDYCDPHYQVIITVKAVKPL